MFAFWFLLLFFGCFLFKNLLWNFEANLLHKTLLYWKQQKRMDFYFLLYLHLGNFICSDLWFFLSGVHCLSQTSSVDPFSGTGLPLKCRAFCTTLPSRGVFLHYHDTSHLFLQKWLHSTSFICLILSWINFFQFLLGFCQNMWILLNPCLLIPQMFIGSRSSRQLLCHYYC